MGTTSRAVETCLDAPGRRLQRQGGGLRWCRCCLCQGCEVSWLRSPHLRRARERFRLCAYPATLQGGLSYASSFEDSHGKEGCARGQSRPGGEPCGAGAVYQKRAL